MKPEDLGAMRYGAELQSVRPYIEAELDQLKRAVVNSVLSAVNNGNLTGETALSKWMEYVSYMKLEQKISQRINIGVTLGNTNQQALNTKE